MHLKHTSTMEAFIRSQGIAACKRKLQRRTGGGNLRTPTSQTDAGREDHTAGRLPKGSSGERYQTSTLSVLWRASPLCLLVSMFGLVTFSGQGDLQVQ